MNVKDFQEADAELVLRLGYVLERARELIEHFPTRYTTYNSGEIIDPKTGLLLTYDSGEMIDPATGWLLEIIVTMASEGASGIAPDNACEIAIDEMFVKMSNYLPGGDSGEEAEWIPRTRIYRTSAKAGRGRK